MGSRIWLFGRRLVRAVVRMVSVALVLLGFLAAVSLVEVDIPEAYVEEGEIATLLKDPDEPEAAAEDDEAIVWWWESRGETGSQSGRGQGVREPDAP